MSKAVDIVLSVIDSMNLTDQDKLQLIEQLGKGVQVDQQLKPKPMTETELFRRKFEKWVVEKKILFPPKNKHHYGKSN
ncbi:hypothetical protein [Labilibaculum euxinus]